MHAELHHEAGDRAEEAGVVEEAALYQRVEAIDPLGRPGAMRLEDEGPLAGLEADAEGGRRLARRGRRKPDVGGPLGAVCWSVPQAAVRSERGGERGQSADGAQHDEPGTSRGVEVPRRGG